MVLNIDTISSKHKKTLQNIFVTPSRSDVKFDRVEALIKALGGKVNKKKGKTSGSRLLAALEGRKLHLHRPHPGDELDKGAVSDVRRFFKSLGITQENLK